MSQGYKRTIVLRPEATYGTYNGAGSDILVRVDQGGSFNMLPMPARHVIRTADATNRPILEVSSRSVLTGTLDFYLFADGVTPNDYATRILNLVTDISSGDLPSFSIDEQDGVRLRRTVGWKVQSGRISCSAENQEGALRISLNCVGQRVISPDPSYTAPALTAYPTKLYRFIDSKGLFIFRTTGSTVRTKYRSFEVNFSNDLVGAFDEDQFVSDVTWCGREITGSTQVRFLAKTDRDAFEARTDHVASIAFLALGGAQKNQLALDFRSRVKITDLPQERALNGLNYETIQFQPFVEASSGSDFAFTSTNPA